MDLEYVLKNLVHKFRERSVRYGLIGGYAVALHGYPRATVDLDFLVEKSDLPRVDEIMRELGYELHHRSGDVSQFVSPTDLYGQVDFIHALRVLSRRMLGEAEAHKLFDTGPEVMVLRVEDVIGFKVQAIANNPSRRDRDLADIRALAAANRGKMDWELLEEYFALFDMRDLCRDLRGAS